MPGPFAMTAWGASRRGVPHIIQIVDHEVLPRAGLIYVLLEFGETDLARLLAKREKARQERGERGGDENFVRCGGWRGWGGAV